MLSRVAERVYWMARYLERAENTARLINVNTNLLLDLPHKVTLGWETLIDITGNKRLFKRVARSANERSVVRFMIADLRNSGSLLSSLHAARENARTIRDIIPHEGWEAVNALYLQIKSELPEGLGRNERFDFLGDVIAGTQRVTGLLAGTMLHDVGYHFLRMGRNLERADMTTRIVDVRSENLLQEESGDLKPFEHIQWMSVLQSLSAYQSFHQKAQVAIRRSPVLRFLLQEVQFPRSFSHCVGEVHSALTGLVHNKKLLAECNHLIDLANRKGADEMTSKQLHRFLDELQLHLAELHQHIGETYFGHELPKTKNVKVARGKKTP